MFNSKKSQYGNLLSTFLRLFLLVIFASPVAAVDLPFDPNDFSFLIYNPGGYEPSIKDAMEDLGISCDIRDFYDGNEVTSEDLETHDILIVGWNSEGDISGLDAEILAAGITGRVILSGHDADFHTVNGPQAAEVFLVQAIDWVLKGSGTGMITLGCKAEFDYLPEFWDVNAHYNTGENVTEFTAEGIASGVYDGLEPNEMSNWGTSYHDKFTIGQDSFFVPFELGGGAGSDIITIATYKTKLHVFDMNKVDNVNDVDCVYPWNMIDENYLVYNICYDANGYADTNVVITDYLPVEVEYYSSSSDPCGVYHLDSNTVTWDINDISGADSNCLQLTVKVNYYAKPGRKIKNYCEMEGDQYFSYTIEETNICCYGGDIIYVNQDANGYNNGTSWLDAYTDLQDAFHTARECGCEQIWVAKGTYRPTNRGIRSFSFELLDNVAVYGGFPPGGGQWVDRDPDAYETVLSGDIAAPNNHSDNSYHVVQCEDVNNAILDGFTITAGNAKGSVYNEWYGGGVYCQGSTNLTLKGCNISDNTAYNGGGLYNQYSSANLTNCSFTDNTATTSGGGMYNVQSSPTIINCTFSGNSADYAGGISNKNYSSPNITNCIFSGNNATYYGGGMYNNESSPTLINSTFSGNSAQHGGGLLNSSASPNITNCIFTGNTVTWSPGAGAGMHNCDFSSLAVANCIFSGNTSYDKAGGINNDYSGVSLTNCTVAGNAAWYGGGMRNTYYSYVDVTNCIFWNNVFDEIRNDSNTCSLYVNYCDVNEVWEGTGNINKDPCFFTVNSPTGLWTADASYDNSTFQSILTNANANWAVNQLAGKFVNPDTQNQYLQFFIVSNNVNTIKVWSNVESIALTGKTYQIYDYHLTADSNCIDAGDPDFNPDANMTDIDGERRVVDGDGNGTEIVDMGADEYYRSPADFNSDGIVNFFDYALFANVWQKTSDVNDYNDIYDLVDNNCIDYADLARFCEDWLWQRAWAKAFPFSYGQGMGKSMGLGMSEGLGLAEEILPSASAKKPQPQVTKADIVELIKWLEELWLTDAEVRKMIGEDEWLKFIESVIQALKSQM